MIAVIILTIALVLSIIMVSWMQRINTKLLKANAELLSRKYRRMVIIPGDYHQGRNYVRACGMNPREVYVITDARAMRGMGDVDILWCGTFELARNYPDIVQQVQVLKASGKVHSEITKRELDATELVLRPSHG